MLKSRPRRHFERAARSFSVAASAARCHRGGRTGDREMRLTDFDALTFDCYGTLIDWETGMIEALKGLTDRVQRPLTRDQILEAHARHESSQQHYTPAKRYRDLLPIVYKRLAEGWGVHATNEDCVE